MSSSPLDTLYSEHDVILRAIDRLYSVLKQPDPSQHAEELRRLLNFFKEYGDGYHHQKEEHVLFPALKDSGETIATMLESLTDHHQQFREMLVEAESALAGNDWPLLEQRLHAYAAYLVDHIGAENDELFVAAESLLSENEMEKIGFRFVDADRERGDTRKREWESTYAL